MVTTKRQGGFTLLELIIVIAIIGILATIAMPALKDMPRRANEAVLKTNLRTLREVIDYYDQPDQFVPKSLNRDSSIVSLSLTEQEKQDLEAFLHALTDDRFVVGSARAAHAGSEP